MKIKYNSLIFYACFSLILNVSAALGDYNGCLKNCNDLVENSNLHADMNRNTQTFFNESSLSIFSAGLRSGVTSLIQQIIKDRDCSPSCQKIMANLDNLTVCAIIGINCTPDKGCTTGCPTICGLLQNPAPSTAQKVQATPKSALKEGKAVKPPVKENFISNLVKK
jgi:hypothetical protein